MFKRIVSRIKSLFEKIELTPQQEMALIMDSKEPKESFESMVARTLIPPVDIASLKAEILADEGVDWDKVETVYSEDLKRFPHPYLKRAINSKIKNVCVLSLEQRVKGEVYVNSNLHRDKVAKEEIEAREMTKMRILKNVDKIDKMTSSIENEASSATE